ncbi:DUF3159 domain-containing protein [Nesterenkonia sp. CL21]|uniref:DUF3159 domain-containing protein n=1 Tax=Nesterenkonia sp. CL21 TaxID=3064894 RepID=UPI00287AF0A7|nr:DUF3159 domain-containing protein [Nesterenkonia sp. CL21]MDS2171969.1 DUF3159 domain-containing protein [Nesterenkonia sp. CL21]
MTDSPGRAGTPGSSEERAARDETSPPAAPETLMTGGATPDSATPDAATPDAATPDAATPDAGRLGSAGGPGQDDPSDRRGDQVQDAAGPDEIGERLAESAGSRLRTREDGSLDVMSSIGGVRGLVEASLPAAAFLTVFVITEDLLISSIVAVLMGLIFTVARLAQRGPLVQSLSGLAVIVLCAVVAQQTGEARDFYLWGFVTNAAYIAGFALSVAVRWPFLGILFGFIRGEGVAWRQDHARRRRYALATWIVTGVLALRLAVQLPLYLADAVVALGTARLVMGLPLYALALWVGWMITRPTVVEDRRDGEAVS